MEDIVPILIVAIYVGLFASERIVPARPLPAVKGWTLKGILFFVMVMALSGVMPAVVALTLGEHSPLGLSNTGLLLGALLTLLVTEFLQYWMHRTFHNVPFLWRWVHQLHHSAERLDIPGAAFTSPLEIIVTGGVAAVATLLLGVGPGAAALAGLVSVFCSIFQHWNVKTPRWVGYVVQRPEAHSVHHARGVHAYNYANLPIFDMLFGTFRNPKEFVETQGFWHGASRRLGAMLLGRDIGEPPAVMAAELAAQDSNAAVANSSRVVSSRSWPL